MLKFACTLCVWAGFLHMHSFRTACRTQARLCLSTGAPSDRYFSDFQRACARRGGGGGLVGLMRPLGSVMRILLRATAYYARGRGGTMLDFRSCKEHTMSLIGAS